MPYLAKITDIGAAKLAAAWGSILGSLTRIDAG